MDNHFLKLAMEEAKKSKDSDGYWVGAIIVKDGNIISKAYSDENNDNSHAEELAIKNSKEDLKGATLYTTIEPCDRRPSGKKSCSELIIDSGIRKVVFGVLDPTPVIPCGGRKIRRSRC